MRPTMLLPVAALVLAGCGGEAEDGGDPSTYDAGSLLPTVREAVAAEEAVHMSIGDTTPPADLEVDIAWGEEDEFRALVGNDPAQQLDVRKVAGRVYVGGEGVGHQWTYLELDDPRLDGTSDFDAGMIPILTAMDVPADFEGLEAGVTDVSEKGAEEVNGVQTTRYEVTVDTQAWWDAVPELSMHRAMDLPETVEMDLYLDEDSLPVRWEYEVPEKRNVSGRIDYSQWGTPVEVAEPKGAKEAR